MFINPLFKAFTRDNPYKLKYALINEVNPVYGRLKRDDGTGRSSFNLEFILWD